MRAFQGLRPVPAIAAKMASLPYDVVSTQEARTAAMGNPLSFFHVGRAEIDLPDGIDPYSDVVYQKALENFKRFQSQGHLVRETEPCLFIYREQSGSHCQIGIAATCHIDDYLNDVIKKHEKTRVEKENDRLRVIQTLQSHSEPVFLLYRDQSVIDAIVGEIIAKERCLYDFTSEDSVRHSVWRVAGKQAEAICRCFGEKVPCAYIADGHHRAASAIRAGVAIRQSKPQSSGEEDFNFFMAVIFPASHLRILPYNRLVADLNGLSAEAFLARLKGAGKLTQSAKAVPENAGDVSIYLAGKWWGLELTIPSDANPVSRLDVSVLQDKVLAPILGINDPRTDHRIDFVGGIRGTSELEKAVDSGKAAVAFSMYPTTVTQLMEISDAGMIMPPKSTWFEPKLRSGLFMHTF